MKKVIFLSIVLLFFNLPISGFAEERTERVLITFHDMEKMGILQTENIQIHHVFENLSAVSATIPVSFKSTLEVNPHILQVDIDPIVKKSQQIEGWGYQTVRASETKQYGLTGKGIKIGIIDTGIRTNHPDLHIAGGVSFIEGSYSYEDDEGHGTHVAGIIGALDNQFGIIGVAPEAEIYAIKSLNSVGLGRLSDVIAGVNWAIQNEIDIINLSLTSPKGHYMLEEVLKEAHNKGIMIIAASGNSSPDSSKGTGAVTDILYPAKYESVVAVGSIDREFNRSKFSYFGPSLDFVAPGEEIYSTFNTTDYVSLEGTSMAAPYVTGIAALYKQAYPTASDDDILKAMQENTYDLGVKGKDPDFGYGLIQAPTEIRKFIDVSNNQWYSDEIDYLVSREVVNGYEGHRFLPESPVTRAEAITMIGRAKNFDGEKKNTKFPDVSNTHYASGYIEQATIEEVILGYPDGSFQPNAPIIRGDVAAMLQRAFTITSNTQTYFSDVHQEAYYYDSINALYKNNILKGYPDQSIKPLANITRAEFSVMLARILNDSLR